jgi:hypothetical protein
MIFLVIIIIGVAIQVGKGTSTGNTIAPTQNASCNPLSSGGTCYEPGQYCQQPDYGTSGVAGNGEAITCEDNNGWRWEPS